MTTGTETAVTTQVYRVYTKATPQAIWDAITQPEWTERYGYAGRVDYDLRPGGDYRAFNQRDERARAEMGGGAVPDVIADGEVLESDPPRKLVQTWRMLMDPQPEAEGFTRLTYEIAETGPGVSKLTVIHELEGAPRLALVVGGEMESMGAAADGARSSATSRRCSRPATGCGRKPTRWRPRGSTVRGTSPPIGAQSVIEPSSFTVHAGLCATSQGCPSGSTNTPE